MVGIADPSLPIEIMRVVGGSRSKGFAEIAPELTILNREVKPVANASTRVTLLSSFT